MNESTGKWYSWGPGGPGEDIPDGVPQELPRGKAEIDGRRGRLLAVVDVHVWENGEAHPQVSFPPEATLSVEDRDRIAEVVRIAREALSDWR